MIGYDTANSSFWVPDDPDFVVCYGDKLYENERAAHARFPRLVSLNRVVDLTAVSALWKDPYSGSDIEPRNAGPETAPSYIKGENAIGVPRPVVYADLSDMRTVATLVGRAGIVVGPAGPGRPWRVFTAHPTGHEHLCGPRTCGFPIEADLTQFWWSSIQGRWHGFTGDLDVSTARDDAFPVHPVPIDPYDIFPTGPIFQFRLGMRNVQWSERVLVEHADGALEHPLRYRDYLKGQLRPSVKFARDRIWRVAHYLEPDFTRPRAQVDWASNKRGPRWQLINNRIKAIDAIA